MKSIVWIKIGFLSCLFFLIGAFYLPRASAKPMPSVNLSEAIKFAPNHKEALLERAIVRLELGKFDDALIDYEGYKGYSKEYPSDNPKDMLRASHKEPIQSLWTAVT